MSRPGVAVVVTGFMGPVHVEALRRAGQQVVGILGSSAEKSRSAATALQIESAYSDLAELLADRRVESVHVTTPNYLHFEQVTSCLRAGKHVLCEKPLAMNAQETASLVALARQMRRAAGVAYNIRYYPLCHEAAERVRNNSTGRVLHVVGSYVQDWLLKPTDFNWRVDSGAGGQLRAVADIGTHWLDLVQFITGERVVALCAQLHTVHPVRRRPAGEVKTFSGTATPEDQLQDIAITTDDSASLMLRFAGGATGSLWVSQVTAGRKNCLRFELAGAEQALAWDSERPNELWIGKRDAPNELLVRDPALLSGPARAISNYPGGHNEGFPDTFKQLFRKFYGYIAAGDITAPEPFPTFADGHQTVLLCAAVLKSHHEQRWVTVEECQP